MRHVHAAPPEGILQRTWQHSIGAAWEARPVLDTAIQTIKSLQPEFLILRGLLGPRAGLAGSRIRLYLRETIL